MPPPLGWTVLALVFLDELLAMAALAVWGAHAGGWPLAVVAALAGCVVWFLVASPRASYGGPVARPVAKVAVFGAGALGLVVAGHPGWAVALLVFSLVVNGLAMLPSVRVLVPEA